MVDTIAIGTLCALFGAIVAYATFARNRSKEDKTEGQQTGMVMSELGYIKSSLDTLSKKMDSQESRIIDILQRLAAVEASAKQAHKRIDHIEGTHRDIE